MAKFEGRSLEEDFAQLNLLQLRIMQEDMRRDMQGAELRFGVSHRTAQRIALLGPGELYLLANVPQPLFKLDDSPAFNQLISEVQAGSDTTTLLETRLAHLASRRPFRS